MYPQSDLPQMAQYRIYGGLFDSRTKIKWMILTVLVPEYIMEKAFGEWCAAVNGSHQMSRALKGTGLEWGMVHAYMANMGHFVLDFSDRLDKRRDNTNGTADPLFKERVEEAMGRSEDPMSRSARINALRLMHRFWALTNKQWVLMQIGNKKIRPNISAEQLENKTKEGSGSRL